MKISRLIAILTLLLRTDYIPASKLAEKFEVSVRTIYRDVKTLEDAGIPIVATTGLRGGIGIMEQYKIDKKLFTAQDISTLLTGLNTVSGSISQGALNQTLEKIRALIPEEHVHAIEVDARKLFIDMTPWAGNSTLQHTLQVIQKSLKQDCVITFSYTTLKQDQSHRRVEPHQLVLKENRWYLRAYCLDRKDFRLFKLQRIKNIELTQEIFTPREFSQKLNDFKDWNHQRITTVEILIDPSVKDHLLIQYKEEDMVEQEDGRFRVKLPFVESDLDYNLLMRHGNKCECLGPPHVREELIRRIDDLRKLYS